MCPDHALEVYEVNNPVQRTLPSFFVPDNISSFFSPNS